MTLITKRTLGDAFDEVAAKFPQNVALVFNESRITYEELKRQVDAVAKGLLRLGIRRGDHLAIWLGNCPEWIVVQLAAIKIGAVVVTVSTRDRTHETRYILSQSESKVLVLSDRFLNVEFNPMLYEIVPELAQSDPGELHSDGLPALRTVISLANEKQPGTLGFGVLLSLGSEVSDDDLAGAQAMCQPSDAMLIIYTSGTTGVPKGAMLTHQGLLNRMLIYTDWLGITESDRTMFGGPLFHMFGSVMAVMGSIVTASTLCLLESFDAERALKTIHEERCTVLLGVPSMFIMMLEHPNFARYDTSCGRTGVIAGAQSPVALIRDVIDKLAPQIVSLYGLTESSNALTATRTDDAPELISTTVGVALPGGEVAIFDPNTNRRLPAGQEGEIRARSAANMHVFYNMKGYYKMPEETAKAIAQDGWLHTGDLGTVDENGYFRITGRLKDMFIVGGANVYPAEIENFIFSHPKVKDVNVVGVPDHRLGEVCMAFILLKDGQMATAEEIIEYCRGRIANYKVPRYVHFVSEFPMTSSGKVQKFKLRDQAIAELGLKKETVV